MAHRRQHADDDVASSDRRSSERDSAKDQANIETKPTLPSDVANARAQMTDDTKAKPAAEAPAQGTAEAATPAAQDPAVQVVNADELNDLDKAATTDVTEPLPKLPPSIANSRAELRFESPSTWAQTSTIGKAFIAFGVMLTLASAARMFMA